MYQDEGITFTKCFKVSAKNNFLFWIIFFLEITLCGMLFPQGGGGVTSKALKKFADPGPLTTSRVPLGLDRTKTD